MLLKQKRNKYFVGKLRLSNGREYPFIHMLPIKSKLWFVVIKEDNLFDLVDISDVVAVKRLKADFSKRFYWRYRVYVIDMKTMYHLIDLIKHQGEIICKCWDTSISTYYLIPISEVWIDYNRYNKDDSHYNKTWETL